MNNETNSNNQQASNNPSNGNFLRAMIKIANPEWSPEQIEAEFQRKMSAPDEEDNSGCEVCSG